MRKQVAVLSLAIVVASLAAALPVSAASCSGTPSHTDCTFTELVPCSFACPYWTNVFNPYEAACAPSPQTLPMSYDQVAVTIPADATSFRAGISPVLDSDLVVCRTVADAQGHYFIATGANKVGEICPGVVFGCAESVELSAAPLAGQTILLRVYNWLDGPTCHGYFEIS